jgi:hypothetical protein
MTDDKIDLHDIAMTAVVLAAVAILLLQIVVWFVT